MLMKSGERWHCSNPHCHCEIALRSDSPTSGSSPQCVCSAAMKRNYASPAFKYLDFLRVENAKPLPQPGVEK
jgi:hypothetical protein